jgi:hypothetical protein
MLNHIVVWALMRVALIDCTFEEVIERRYQVERRTVFVCGASGDLERKIKFLENKQIESKERRKRVDDKSRTLLTLTALLLGLISSATGIASPKNIGIWSIVPLILLFITIFLTTIYFSVDYGMTTDYGYVLSMSDTADIELCNDLLMCNQYNEKVSDFMVDLYRAALRYFFLAMLSIFTIVVIYIVHSNINWESFSRK